MQSAVSLAASGTDPDAVAALERWLDTLVGIVDRADVHGLLVGRMVRVLRDTGRLDDAPVRLHRALSVGVPSPAKAAWVDGFFADGALLLIHDRELLVFLGGWVRELSAEESVAALPLARRTFGSFSAAERRSIATRVRAGDRAPVSAGRDDVDDERGLAALATVATILEVRG